MYMSSQLQVAIVEFGDGAGVVRVLNEQDDANNDVSILVTDLQLMQQSASPNVDLAAGLNLAAEMLAFGDS